MRHYVEMSIEINWCMDTGTGKLVAIIAWNLTDGHKTYGYKIFLAAIILLVRQCGADIFSITRVLRQRLKMHFVTAFMLLTTAACCQVNADSNMHCT